MGDDPEEFGLIQHMLTSGQALNSNLYYRVSLWWLNALVIRLLGLSEATYFLPTWLMSASLSVIGYRLLLRWDYPLWEAALAGLFVATAPFEVFIGTVRANDLILSWFLALGLLAFVRYERQPVRQGIALAVALWLGFYVKIWAAYALPPLTVYYLVQLRRNRWRGMAAFAGTSGALHATTALFWKLKTGSWLPFLSQHAATYPIAPKDLLWVFGQYPSQLFRGSEFGITLFGTVPYLVLGLHAIKLGLKLSWRSREPFRALDRWDRVLILYYVSWLLLINFFPMAFVFDHYYSAGRIFRYLTPLSFPITLHAAKLLLDLGRLMADRFRAGALVTALFVPLLAVNVIQTAEATRLGRIYRWALLPLVADVKHACPPQVLSESWLSHFLAHVYLRGACAGTTSVIHISGNVGSGAEYEAWLAAQEPTLPEGTMLITGLGNYVYYGCHTCGFLLRQFQRPLSPRWVLVKEYGVLPYLTRPEPARLWRLTGRPGKPTEEPLTQEASSVTDRQCFEDGMARFDAEDYEAAKRAYGQLVTGFPDSPLADDARYFLAVIAFRASSYAASRAQFSRLLAEHPDSSWAAAAHYHLGLIAQALQDIGEAEKQFRVVITRFRSDRTTVGLAREQLRGLNRQDGLLPSLWRAIKERVTSATLDG